MRAIDPSFDEKIISQIHDSLGALDEGFSTKQKWTFGQWYYTGTSKVKQTSKSIKIDQKQVLIFVTLVGITDNLLQRYDSIIRTQCLPSRNWGFARGLAKQEVVGSNTETDHSFFHVCKSRRYKSQSFSPIDIFPENLLSH